MTEPFNLQGMTRDEFVHLGEGAVAYVRKMKSDDLLARYPGIAEIAPGLDVWTLFAADGQPILLAGDRDVAMAGALRNELTAVHVH